MIIALLIWLILGASMGAFHLDVAFALRMARRRDALLSSSDLPDAARANLAALRDEWMVKARRAHAGWHDLSVVRALWVMVAAPPFVICLAIFDVLDAIHFRRNCQ